MNLSSCVAEYEVRDYLAFREVLHFCYSFNCDYIEDASSLRIVSKSTLKELANVPSKFVADSRVDTPHVALLRELVRNESERDFVLFGALVRELLSSSAA